jgi:branched-chain amino acid:cation transporter, LIVCS family
LLCFSAISCGLLFLCTYRPRRILSLLGYVLTPMLLLSLAIIVIKGLWGMPKPDAAMHTGWVAFKRGLLDGYNTLDLLAAFFFSSIVLLCLKKNHTEKSISEKKTMLSIAMLGSLIAAFLLTFFYVCFAFLAAGHSVELQSVASDQLLGTLASKILGSQAGLIASALVCFACFTTEVALTAIFAGFLQKTLFKEKISYPTALVLTLLVAFLVSTLHFNGISAFLVPIVQICYPSLIVLSVLNIAHKLWGFKPVKSFVYGTMVITLAAYLFF